MKKYVIINNRGDFFDGDFEEYSAGWTCLSSLAKVFDTYNKAYYMAMKLNMAYGFIKCRVSSL